MKSLIEAMLATQISATRTDLTRVTKTYENLTDTVNWVGGGVGRSV